MKYLCALLAAMQLVSASGAETSPGGTKNSVRLTAVILDAYVESMRTNHPALRAQFARVGAAGHAAEGVRTWGDPTLAFGGTVSDGARGPALREDGDLVFELEQPLPLFGKARAARTVAQREAETETARATVVFQTLRRDLMKTVITLATQEELIALAHEDLAWLETALAAATGQHRAGNGSANAVLKLQTEHARRKDALLTETRRREQVQVSLNRQLQRPLHETLPAHALPEIAPSVPYSSNLVEHALRHEPTLLVLASELRAARAQADIARKSRLPDVGGFVEGRQYSGDGGFREATIGVKLTLPWFNGRKYRGDLERERARADAVRFESENAAQLVHEELHRLTVELDAARREALLYRDEILPRAQLMFETLRSQWLNGQVPLAESFDARREWLEARQQSVRAVAAQQQLLNELALAAGFERAANLEQFLGKNVSSAIVPATFSTP